MLRNDVRFPIVNRSTFPKFLCYPIGRRIIFSSALDCMISDEGMPLKVISYFWHHLMITNKSSPRTAGLRLEGDLGEKVSLNWLTSPYFELREKFKCIVHIGSPQFGPTLLPEILKTPPSLRVLG